MSDFEAKGKELWLCVSVDALPPKTTIAHIVKCVNEHDDLVTSLTTALATLKAMKEEQGMFGFENVWKKEYAVLTKARGGA